MTGRAQRAAVVIARRMGRAGLSGRGGRRTTDGPARRSFSRQRFTRGGRIEDDRLQAQKQGLREIGMPDSGIVDLGLGLAFVFGVTAAIGSVATELIARLLGLRGAYLLRGLRELLDGDGKGPRTYLTEAEADYAGLKKLIAQRRPPASGAGTDAGAAHAGAGAEAGAGPGDQHPPASAPKAAHAQAGPARQPDRDAQAGDSTEDPSATSALLGGPIMRSQGMAGQISSRKLMLESAGKTGRPAKLASSEGERLWRVWRDCRSLPSYISARSFAEAVIDLVVPDADAAGQASMLTIKQSVGALPDSMSTLKQSLQALVKNAGDDVGLFRASVEHWYDDHMDRVSGWYKRHVAKITLLAGVIIVLLLNVNALAIGRALYSDGAVRAAVSAVAARRTACPANQSQQACLDGLQAQVSALVQAGLPIGWGTVRDCAAPKTACNWPDRRGIFSRHGSSGWQVVLVLIGFLITITALVPGAQFWFGLLGKIGNLGATGPKPAPPAS